MIIRNYVTVLNHKFLPQLLALYESMEDHCGDFQLFIICIDKKLYNQLLLIKLADVILIDLEAEEDKNPRLKTIKSNRKFIEYCWTLSSFSFSIVKENYPEITQLTYIDTDIFFFSSPGIFFDELEHSRKNILITEHAFAPEYSKLAKTNGIYCVQFLVVNFNRNAMEVISEWQNLCEECCCEHPKNGQFGDQKYLDDWPNTYPEVVHVLSQKNKAQAPWNVNHLNIRPVFYHFQGFRFVSPKHVCTAKFMIKISKAWIYEKYIATLREKVNLLLNYNISIPYFPHKILPLWRLRALKRRLINRELYIIKKL